MPISLAGLIGAAIGLYIGWLDYRIVTGMLRAAIERKRLQTGTPGALARHEALVRGAVLVVTVIGFPMLGYFAARQLAG